MLVWWIVVFLSFSLSGLIPLDEIECLRNLTRFWRNVHFSEFSVTPLLTLLLRTFTTICHVLSHLSPQLGIQPLITSSICWLKILGIEAKPNGACVGEYYLEGVIKVHLCWLSSSKTISQYPLFLSNFDMTAKFSPDIANVSVLLPRW